MAIYHFSAKVISRATGSSAVAASAYRSASRLRDERLDRSHDFSNKAGVVHSEVLLPEGAPDEWQDREKLWNDVEAAELRKDAQLAREIEFAIPREMTQEQGIELARDFVQREFVDQGMVADLNVHWDIGVDGEPKPHAHVMLTMREVNDEGFGPKVRDWNRTEHLSKWREAWADHANQRLAELDIDARIDHRSLAAQGIDLEPQNKIGPAASRIAGEGLTLERIDEHRAIAQTNGEKLLANPNLALEAITHQQATFTSRDLAKFVHRHSDGKDQFDAVLSAVRNSPDLVPLGKDGRGEQRFTSRAMVETEQRLEQATASLAERSAHSLPAAAVGRAIAAAESRGLILGVEQQAAFEHVASGPDLANIIGYAGTGKSAMLGVAREAWEAGGLNVRGLALSGIAAENLESGSGIASRTIASMEHQWGQGREQLTRNDVLVIDEAGMVGTRQLERVIGEAERAGAKVVLVGDPEQLQAIEAGAAFRSINERHGGVEITTIRRQQEDWQRDATRHLATGRTHEAVAAYEEAGHVHAAETRAQARDELVDRWDRDRIAAPNASRIILTHTNDEVRELNLAIRERLRGAGAIGEDIAMTVERGERNFASGDRVMFLKNERSLGVKNGSLGSIQSLTQSRMAVMLDDGRSVAFDVKDYAHIDHGYAATIHKAQGMTVNRVQVLATPGLDRHASYVALSRHRERVDLHYGKEDFADRDRLVRTLSRERGKDMASDYAVERVPEPVATPKRNPFAGLKLNAAPVADRTVASPLDKAVQRYARTMADILRSQEHGHSALPHQRDAFYEARDGLDKIRPRGSRDLYAAIKRDGSLVDQAVKGKTANVVRAMDFERDSRITDSQRADRFIDDWKKQTKQLKALDRAGRGEAVYDLRQRMASMAKGLERDPQLESLVRNRVKELGISPTVGQSLSQDLQRSLSLSLSRGLGL
jgi:Ti-type conjugative transfer relaxase TraA